VHCLEAKIASRPYVDWSAQSPANSICLGVYEEQASKKTYKQLCYQFGKYGGHFPSTRKR